MIGSKICGYVCCAVLTAFLCSGLGGPAVAEGPPTDRADMYGTKLKRFGGLRKYPHRGVDYWVPKGTPVLAPADGQVVKVAYTQCGGQYLVLRHSDEVFTMYMNLSMTMQGSPTRVKRGQVIARVGESGSCAPKPNLHFEVRLGGYAVDPYKGYWYPDGDTPRCFRPDHDYPEGSLAFTHPIKCDPE